MKRESVWIKIKSIFDTRVRFDGTDMYICEGCDKMCYLIATDLDIPDICISGNGIHNWTDIKTMLKDEGIKYEH